MGSSQFAPLTNPRTVIVAGAPTVNDDNTAGYGVGNIWNDTTNNVSYICVDASTGAAVWNIFPAAVDNSTIEYTGSNTLQVKDSGIIENKIGAGAITPTKRGTFTYFSNSCGSFSTTSTTSVDVTNLNVTLNTEGRPVKFELIPDQTTNLSEITIFGTVDAANFITEAGIELASSSVLDNISISNRVNVSSGTVQDFNQSYPPGTITFWLPAGTTSSTTFRIKTYIVTIGRETSAIQFDNIKLVATIL